MTNFESLKKRPYDINVCIERFEIQTAVYTILIKYKIELHQLKYPTAI